MSKEWSVERRRDGDMFESNAASKVRRTTELNVKEGLGGKENALGSTLQSLLSVAAISSF